MTRRALFATLFGGFFASLWPRAPKPLVCSNPFQWGVDGWDSKRLGLFHVEHVERSHFGVGPRVTVTVGKTVILG